MSLRTLESSFLIEAQRVSGRYKLRLKDILAWQTSEFKGADLPRDGEVMYHLPHSEVWIIFPTDEKLAADKAAKKAAKVADA